MRLLSKGYCASTTENVEEPSERNIEHLEQLVESENENIAELANIVLGVARVKPYKKKRLRVLARERRDLLEKLDETGLIMAHHW